MQYKAFLSWKHKTRYFESVFCHNELNIKGVKVNEVQDDLFGPGSGVKWFDFEDPDGNQVKLAQV